MQLEGRRWGREQACNRYNANQLRQNLAEASLPEPRDHARAHIVHGVHNRELVVVHQTREHRAPGDQLAGCVARVALADFPYECLVLGASGTAGSGHFRHGRLNVLELRRQITELHVVDRTLDRAAIRMPQDDDELGSRLFGRVFEAAEDSVSTMLPATRTAKMSPICSSNTSSGDTPAVHAAQHRSEGRLTRGRELHLCLRIAMKRATGDEPRIAFLQAIERLFRGRGALPCVSLVRGAQVIRLDSAAPAPSAPIPRRIRLVVMIASRCRSLRPRSSSPATLESNPPFEDVLPGRARHDYLISATILPHGRIGLRATRMRLRRSAHDRSEDECLARPGGTVWRSDRRRTDVR